MRPAALLQSRLAQLVPAFLLLAILSVLLGCTTTRTVRSVDLTRQSGIYVVGYTHDLERRGQFERQLVGRLIEQQFKAYASIDDIPDIAASTPQQLITQAREHQAVAVLMIKPVNSTEIQAHAQSMPSKYQILQDLYDESKAQIEHYDPNQEAVFEVYGFILNSKEPQLFWSGTTWTFVADGMGSGINSITTILTEELVKLRDKIRSGQVDLFNK